MTVAGELVAAESSESGGLNTWWDGVLYPVLPHLGELVVGLVAFGVLYYLVARFVVPRFEKTYEERRDAIVGGMERAEQAQAEAEAALAEYNAQLASARTEASRLREEARAEGATILAEMRERAAAEAARITESAQRQVQAERQQAMAQLRTEVGGLATTLASTIVGESLADSARQSRVIDRFLAELERADPDDVRAGAAVGAPARDGAEDEPGAVRTAVAGAKRLLGGLTGGDDKADAAAAPSAAEPRTTGGATRSSTRPPRSSGGAPRTSGGSTRAPRGPDTGGRS